MKMTPVLAYAIGRDAGNRSMRKAGRKKWNLTDRNIACAEINRCLDLVEGFLTMADWEAANP